MSWASHLALTDETGHRFLYGQRTEIGPQVDRRPRGRRRHRASTWPCGSIRPTRRRPVGAPWTMAGGGGHDQLCAMARAGGRRRRAGRVRHRPGPRADQAAGAPRRRRLGRLRAGRRLVLLLADAHGGALARSTLDGDRSHVTGHAWFDHQWGDFIAVGGGGWDWFAVNLDDGTDLTLSLVRDADGSYPLVYGTLVDAGRAAIRHLDRDGFTVDATGRGRARRPGPYPAGWHVDVPGRACAST